MADLAHLDLPEPKTAALTVQCGAVEDYFPMVRMSQALAFRDRGVSEITNQCAVL